MQYPTFGYHAVSEGQEELVSETREGGDYGFERRGEQWENE